MRILIFLGCEYMQFKTLFSSIFRPKRGYFNKPRLETDEDAEIQSYLQKVTDEWVERGIIQ